MRIVSTGIMLKINRLACILLIVWLFSNSATAQFYNGSQMTFGKNRVQYTNFLWTYYRFNNYDVYYYLNGKELAQHTADYAGKYIPEIEKKLETTLDKKTQFIVYNTYSDLKQSNIGLMNNSQYNTGGITHIIGTKVFLYFDGDLNHFDRQIRGGITRLLLENIIYGGSLGSQVKNSTLITLPDWYIDGLVSYYSRNWDTELDNKVKDGILSKKFKRFNHLIDDDAVLAGHSLWRFIAEKYGEENIANILYMTRVNRSVEGGFVYVLGISFKDVIEEWYDWYKQIYSADNQDYSQYNPKVSFKIKKDRVYDNMRISPDGERMVYSVNDNGLYKVFIYDMATGKKKRIFRTGYRTDEKVDYSYPLLAWHPAGNVISMIIERKGLLYIYFYDMETRKWQSQNLFNFQKIIDFSYSPDGRLFVMSAVQRGQSDIYVYNIASNTAEPITSDVYNDLNPSFLPKTNFIIFSSNRPDDTIRFTRENLTSYDGQENNDLFIYDRNSGSNVLKRVTNTRLANEIQPLPYSPGYFTYLSDANGVYNRYAARFDSTVAYVDTTVHYRYYTQTFPLTNYPQSILSQDVSYVGRKTAELFRVDNKYHIYSGEIPVGPIVPLQGLGQTKYMADLQEKAQKEKKEEALRKLNVELEQKITERTIELENRSKILEEKEIVLTNTIKNLNLKSEELQSSTMRLKAANKELEAFSYSVSHDLRAPLRAINGFVNILNEEYSGILDVEGKRICSIIHSNSVKMGQLIDDLLSFSRLIKSELHHSTIDMQNIVRELISEFQISKELNPNIIVLKELPQSIGDTNLIKQVWMNLISNAIKYSSKTINPQIIIGATQNENETIYFIKDNGVGFNMNYSHKLFGVFQRLHGANEFEGTGVGLAIVQRIVSRHGGRVWAEGEIDKGATFYFTLPIKNVEN